MTLTRRRIATALFVVVTVLIGATAARAVIAERDDAGRHYLGSDDWPTHGQAAYAKGDGDVDQSPRDTAVPIASLAKVMTAYLVLRAYPLGTGSSGFTVDITAEDVHDTAVRRTQDQSIVPVREGEQLTEREALAAVLLPSANNIAVILAKIVAGSVASFVALMNDMAHSLHMQHTLYTDPSGFAASTRSTAADQVRLARTAMAVPAFADLVSRTSFDIPVAGTVRNTDALLGKDGFAGIKTGSMDASGGCFMFVTRRLIGGAGVEVYGVVLGQPGHNLITAALTAARQLADKVSASAA